MTTATSEFRLIPLAEIHESKHNPRKHFDGPALEQLTDSIRKVGVITPALVRPNAKGFELAAGHRRYRASKLAGLEVLPCLVRPMPDQEFMEVLTIENLQREDVHPLDEAQGYEALMAAPYKMPVEQIAERVGKSIKYVYDRVKLLALCKEGRDLFWSGQIEAGHAILLARLPQEDQRRVIGDKEADYRNGGLFQIEHLLYEEVPDGEPVKAVSVRELADYVKRHIRFDAKAADSFLFPETVSKVNEAVQAKTKIIEITHDYLADEAVRKAGSARVYGCKAWKRADGKEESKCCECSVMGVVVQGAGQGEAFLVCANKEKCLVHWGTEIRARQKRQKGEGATAAKGAEKESSSMAKYRLQQERDRKERERWEAAVPAMRIALAERVKKAPVKVGSFLIKVLIEDLRQYRQPAGVVQMVSPGKTAEELLRHLGWLYVSKRLEYGPSQGERVVKALGLDVKKFLPKPEAAKAVQAAQQAEVKQENAIGSKKSAAKEARRAKARKAA